MLGASDVDQQALADAQRPPATVSLQAQTEQDQAKFVVANIGAILILVGIFSFGFTVLTGVVEEKQSRVVEVVLSTVRPRDLLMGKVLGIGVLGIVQLAVFMIAAMIAALATKQLELPSTTPGTVVLLAVWFVLGYLLYSTALGFLGALASRQEEASNASTPVTMVAMLSYFVAIFAVIDDPNGLVANIAHLLPAVGAVRRPAPGRLRCDPAVADRHCRRSSRSSASTSCSRSARGSTPAPSSSSAAGSSSATRGGRPGSSPSRRERSNSPGVPPACQKTTRRPSSWPARTSAMSPASALAV